MVIILRVYDGQDNPSWPAGLTLNSVIAVLTTLAKLGLVYPIIEGLGQLRWNIFVHKNRPLRDFELLDQASRGGIKAGFHLLGSLRGG
jgi:hypothetical protein